MNLGSRNRWWGWRVVPGLALLTVVWLGSSTGSARQTPDAAESKASHKPGDELLGEWWTEGREGRVRFTKFQDGTFRGTTTCCNPTKDVNNPDPKLRSRSTVGIVIIWDLAYKGDKEYEDGHVYNPRDGKTYGFDVEVLDANTIEITGYLGIPLFGQSQTWKRVQP